MQFTFLYQRYFTYRISTTNISNKFFQNNGNRLLKISTIYAQDDDGDDGGGDGDDGFDSNDGGDE